MVQDAGCHSPRRIRSGSIIQQRSQLLATLSSALFVIGTAVILFAAFRNTLTWHLQRFWGASGDFWETQWGKVYHLCGGDEKTIFLLGTTIVTFCCYWIIGGLYTIVDMTGKPVALLRYKIQPGKNEPVETTRLLRVIGQVLFNQLVVGTIMTIIALYLMRLRGYSYGPELPTFQWVLLEMIVFIILEEFGFYYSHRLLHHPAVYKYIHKQHHEWTAPIAITAIYAHPVEHIMSNTIPILLGPIAMGSHIATSWLWFCLAILSTLNAHCGFHLPFLPSPEAHDFHHLKFNQNFGMLGLLDRLHGTDTMFRNTKAYQRHIMLLSFIPMRQSYPDEPRCKDS